MVLKRKPTAKQLADATNALLALEAEYTELQRTLFVQRKAIEKLNLELIEIHALNNRNVEVLTSNPISVKNILREALEEVFIRRNVKGATKKKAAARKPK